MMLFIKPILFLLLCSTSLAQAEDIAVIVAADSRVHPLTPYELEDIFLRKTPLSREGERWIPVNLPAQHPIRAFFTAQIIQKTPFELERYWYKQYFNGIPPPYVLASEEAILRFVTEHPYAISYILSCHTDKRVKIIAQLKGLPTFNVFCAHK